MHADGSLEALAACAEVVIAADERMVSISAGGGGYGSPHEREAHRVAHDVREGWVSRDRAEAIYGVVLRDNFTVDEERTSHLRRQ